MEIRIQDILQMKEMEGATIIAGNNGVDRIVQSTTVLDAPDAVMWLKGKELVFTSTYPLLNSIDHLDVLIQELTVRNVSGLALKLNRYMKELPQEMIDAANEYHFPIICLPIEKAWIDLITPIMSEILKLRTRRLQRSEEINKSFTNILLSNSSIKNIFDLLHEYIENPVTKLALMNNDIMRIPENGCNEQIEKVRENFEYYMNNNSRIIDSKHNISRLTIENYSYIVFPLENKKGQENFIIVEELYRKVNKDDIDCMLHAKNAFLIKDLQQKSEREYKRKNLDELISIMVSNDEDNNDISEIRRKAWEIGIELQEKYVLIVSRISSHTSPETIYEVIDYVLFRLKPKAHTIVGLDNQNNLIVFFPIDDINTITECKLDINNLLNNLVKHYQDLWISSGVSQVFKIELMSKAYNQSIKSLEYAFNYKEHTNNVQFYDDLGIYRLFSHPLMQDELHKLIDDLLSPLIEYDNNHKSDLINTLGTFLHNKGNYRKTAKDLFLHHNTVRYRLNTISQLINRDINDYHTQLQYGIVLLLYPNDTNPR